MSIIGMMERKAVIFLVVIVALAGLVRFEYCAYFGVFHSENRGEEAEHHLLAKNIAAGRGFVDDQGRNTARSYPAYPLVLGFAYKIFGPHKIYGRLLQAVLGTVVVLLVFFVARKYAGGCAPHAAAALAAFNPLLVTASGYLLNENIYTIFLLGALWLLPGPENMTGRTARVLAAAALTALAALTRHTAAAVAVWMLLSGLLFGAGPPIKRIRYGLAASAVFLLILMPWSVRNHQRLGQWVGVSTSGGITYYQGNNPQAADFALYRGGATPRLMLPMYNRIASAPEPEADRMAWRMGNEFLRHNWRYAPRLAWSKFLRFWRLKTDAGFREDKNRWWWNHESILRHLSRGPDVGLVYAVVVFPLFVAGVVLTRRRWKDLLFLYGVVVTHTLMAVVFYGSLRGRIPVEPVIAVFAAVTADRIWSRFCTRRSGPALR